MEPALLASLDSMSGLHGLEVYEAATIKEKAPKLPYHRSSHHFCFLMTSGMKFPKQMREEFK